MLIPRNIILFRRGEVHDGCLIETEKPRVRDVTIQMRDAKIALHRVLLDPKDMAAKEIAHIIVREYRAAGRQVEMKEDGRLACDALKIPDALRDAGGVPAVLAIGGLFDIEEAVHWLTGKYPDRPLDYACALVVEGEAEGAFTVTHRFEPRLG